MEFCCNVTVAGLSSRWTGFYPRPVHVIEFRTVKRLHNVYCILTGSGVPRNFVQGVGGLTNSVEDRENGDLGAVAPPPPPSQGFWKQL